MASLRNLSPARFEVSVDVWVLLADIGSLTWIGSDVEQLPLVPQAERLVPNTHLAAPVREDQTVIVACRHRESEASC